MNIINVYKDDLDTYRLCGPHYAMLILRYNDRFMPVYSSSYPAPDPEPEFHQDELSDEELKGYLAERWIYYMEDYDLLPGCKIIYHPENRPVRKERDACGVLFTIRENEEESKPLIQFFIDALFGEDDGRLFECDTLPSE